MKLQDLIHVILLDNHLRSHDCMFNNIEDFNVYITLIKVDELLKEIHSSKTEDEIYTIPLK